MTSAWVGERVRLRGVEPGDWVAFAGFDEFSDDVRNSWFLPPPRSAEAAKRWAAELAVQDPGFDEFRLVIAVKEDGAAAGMINTQNIDTRSGTFSYGIGVGRPYQGKGLAREAVVLTLRYMFAERRFQKCDITVYGSNAASLALHERLGFVVEGRKRRSHYAAGRFEDVVLLGMTIEEFDQLHGL
ncbi:GNAT family N-acetyltransferase [Nonomuraea sp. NPDC050556]|uniref:GNAT family N-acetyltransferase n=1 Tax=Nonomuraea sp. NPDC050556 TaxID=3364369 RepID=UPI0037BA4E89